MGISVDSSIIKNIAKRLGVGAGFISLNPSEGTISAVGPAVTVVEKFDELKDLGGAISLDAKQFLSVVHKLTKKAELSSDGLRLKIQTPKTKFDLAGTTINVPKIAVIPPTKMWPLNSVKDAISFTAGVTARKQVSTFSPGVIKLDCKSDVVTAVGTDGYRVAITSFPVNGRKDGFFLLPADAIHVVKNLEGKEIGISENDNNLFFAAGNSLAIVRKMEVKFPGFEHLVPKKLEFQSEILAEEFNETLSQVAPVKDEEILKVVLEFGSKLRLLASDKGNSAESSMDYSPIDPPFDLDPDAPRIRFKLNHKHLTDFFSGLKGVVKVGSTTLEGPMWLESGEKKMLMATIK